MKIIKPLIFCCLTLMLMTIFDSAAAREPLPKEHPEELPKGNPICTKCHEAVDNDIVFKRYNHTLYFTENHRFEAYQNNNLCSMCHRQSFCSDCHAVETVLKPSIKNQSDTYRRTPHRGDYLIRHRIDGRIDPTSCFRCHGNPKAAERCVRCHG
jgi:hypothetical protein